MGPEQSCSVVWRLEELEQQQRMLAGAASILKQEDTAPQHSIHARAGPYGRRGDQVGGFTLMNANDLRRMAPLWLKYTEDVRFDPDVSLCISILLRSCHAGCRRCSSCS